jgi:hypothetical protein
MQKLQQQQSAPAPGPGPGPDDGGDGTPDRENSEMSEYEEGHRSDNEEDKEEQT